MLLGLLAVLRVFLFCFLMLSFFEVEVERLRGKKLTRQRQKREARVGFPALSSLSPNPLSFLSPLSLIDTRERARDPRDSPCQTKTFSVVFEKRRTAGFFKKERRKKKRERERKK